MKVKKTQWKQPARLSISNVLWDITTPLCMHNSNNNNVHIIYTLLMLYNDDSHGYAGHSGDETDWNTVGEMGVKHVTDEVL